MSSFVFERVCFVSVSGGKDSTLTLALALEKYKDTDVPVVPVFCDTKWEHPETYRYLEELERFFAIRIHRIEAFKGGLPALIRKKGVFPSPRRRYCTQILKTEAQRKFYESFYFSFPFRLAEVWIGIRKEESIARRNTEDFLLKAGQKTRFGEKYPFDILFYYPIKDLTKEEVFRELRKRGVPLNPLYQDFERVGCYPCFLSRKEIVQVIQKALGGDPFSQKRLKEMRELDKAVPGRFHVDYSLDELIKKANELIKKAKEKAKMLELPFEKSKAKLNVVFEDGFERIRVAWETIKRFHGKRVLEGRKPLPLFYLMIKELEKALKGGIYYIVVWNVILVDYPIHPDGKGAHGSFILYNVKDGILHLNPFLKWKIEKQKRPVVLTGDTRSSRLVRLFQKYGIGRMFIEKPIRPYPAERWGFDNGAYGDFLKGKEFDADRYRRNLEKAIKIAEAFHLPYLAVLPDVVGGGMRSLELSIYWLEKELRYIPFPWYLAVQDGMSVEEVKEVLISYPQIRGLFLGGTDEFKKTAPMWSSLAHSLGRKFHYARAGSVKKVREAIKANADSLDSSLPLWSEEKLRRFLKALNPAMELPLFETVGA